MPAQFSWLIIMMGLITGISGQTPTTVLQLSPEQAIQRAMEWSPELRSLAVQEQASLSSYQLGLREYFPKVSMDFWQSSSIILDGPDSRTTRLGITLTQLIFDAGRLATKRDLSRLQLVINRADLSEKQLDLADQVRQVCYQMLQEREKLAVQSAIIDLSSLQLDIARKELALGMSREIDVAETESALDNLLLEKASSEIGLQGFRRNLGGLLGLSPEQSAEPTGSIDLQYAGIDLPDDPARLVALALEHSRELLRQNYELYTRKKQLQAAGVWFLPDLSLEGNISFSGSRFPLQTPGFSAKLIFAFPLRSFPVKESLAYGTVGNTEHDSSAATSVGILDDLSAASEETAARAALAIEGIKAEAMKRDIEIKAAQGLAAYRLLIKRMVLQRRSIASQERKNLVLAKQLEIGEIKRIDYVTSETQVAQARNSLIEQVVQLMTTERSLERLLGLEAGGLARLVEVRK